MAKLFARRVDRETATFDDVPRQLKAATAEILINEYNRPELVPVEFGGTKE